MKTILCSMLLVTISLTVWCQSAVVEANGNVGIGTGTPEFKLDIVSSEYKSLRLSANYPLLKLSSPLYNNGNGAEIWQSKEGNLYFNIHSNLSAIVATNQGFIGLGTNFPNEKLSVNGNIRAREIKVEASNWPDYVFSKSHTMLTLTELESYIKVHNHLPGIQSAKEAAEKGINIGEMNEMLLKKIEELTLYLIESNKRLNDQQENITELNRQLGEFAKVRNDKIRK